ncbi:DNA topoisomerase [Cercospora zeina]
MVVTRVLCVAEKPSIAKAVAGHLGGGHFQTRNINGNQYVKNYEFSFNFPAWGHCEVTMTSVLGHLMDAEFGPRYKNWYSQDPSVLFDAPIEILVADKMKAVARNIGTKARNAHYLYIWTDCDREGEHIGTEIMKCAQETNQRFRTAGRVVRARFSNIERTHVLNAARNPITLDEAQANAVYARQELDLRIGACFTRRLTIDLKDLMPWAADERGKYISYGSCQFPTLGFVVERYLRVRNFVPETFWGIKVMHRKDDQDVNFRWARTHLFDRMVTTILYEKCLNAREAVVSRVNTKPTTKWRPLPLTTVELQKCGSRFLRMNGQRVMSVAESLYQRGFISYPRTETDQFDNNMDLRQLVQKQAQNQSRWAGYAQGLLNGGFRWPRNGRHNDKAHPPIHPVNFVNATALDAESQRVYEFVTRRFLACCSDDAKGSKTDRNYLDVYPYDKWTSSQVLPDFRQGESFVPTSALMHEGQTSPPGYLTEPELIALMDTNGIGTDATMAEHISKIKEREYVQTRPKGQQARQNDENEDEDEVEAPAQAERGGRGRGGRGGRGGNNNRAGGTTTGVEEFIPTTLGLALIEGYESMGHEISMAKPFLRKQMEAKLKDICENRITKNDMVHEMLEQYRATYVRTREGMHLLRASVRKYVQAIVRLDDDDSATFHLNVCSNDRTSSTRTIAHIVGQANSEAAALAEDNADGWSHTWKEHPRMKRDRIPRPSCIVS